MIPAALDYRRAATLADALDAIATGDGTKVIAGGHSLLPLLKFRMATVDRLVDIGGLDELKGIAPVAGGIRIGGGTTYRELMDSDVLAAAHPVIREATNHVADRQVRNRGTIGGGLAHADPASDTPALMLALDAVFTLQSKSGQRTVAAREFFLGPFETALGAGELLVAITIPDLPPGSGAAYVSVEQKASGYAIVGAAAVMTLEGGKVSAAQLAYTGLSDTAFVWDAGAALSGKAPGDDVFAKAASAAIAKVRPNEDIHASADYRRHLAVVVGRNALREAARRAG